MMAYKSLATVHKNLYLALTLPFVLFAVAGMAADWRPEKPLDPYSTKAVMLAPSWALVFSSESSSIFLADYSVKAPLFNRLADLPPSSSVSEAVAYRSPSGDLLAAYLELSSGIYRLKSLSQSGGGTATISDLKVFEKGIFPRNLTMAPGGDGGAVFFFILSKADYRDHFYANSWDRLYYLKYSPGKPPVERELFAMEALHPGAYAAVASGQEFTLVRYAYRRGKMDLLLSTSSADGSSVAERALTSFDPGSKEARATLQLSVTPSGQEILAVYSGGEGRSFYRIDKAGRTVQKSPLPQELNLIGICAAESQLLMSKRDSTELHWLSKSGEGFCDEAFSPPSEIVRISQEPSGCYFWLENSPAGPALRKYCKRGC